MPESLEDRLRVLNSRKEMYYSRIQNIFDATKKLDSDKYVKYFTTKIQSLEQTKTEFYEIINDINIAQLKLDKNYEPNYNALESFDDLYCAILLAKTDPRVSSNATTSDSATNSKSNQNHSAVSLPKINLPKFSGDLKDWPIFYECFQSIIHNNDNLSDVDKVNYLTGQLSGPASNICRGLPPVGSNYLVIWEALKSKYQNPRLLATYYLDQILEFKPWQNASASNLNSIIEKCDSSFQALQKLGLNDLLDFTFAHLLWSKLDLETRNIFENTNRNLDIITYDNVLSFIREQAQIYAMSSISKKGMGSLNNKTKSFFVKEENKPDCIFCRSTQHSLSRCSEFLSKPPYERYKFIKTQNVCILCFGFHKVHLCKNVNLCKICKYKHNTLLHFARSQSFDVSTVDKTNPDNWPTETIVKAEKPTDVALPSTSSLCTTVNNTVTTFTVLLSTVVVNITGKDKMLHSCRLLLDSGSQANFLTLDCAKRFGLDIYELNSTVKGIGGSNNLVLGNVNTIISSRLDSNICFKVDFLLVEKVTNQLPDFHINCESLDYLFDLPLADNTFYRPGPIDGIIGAQLFGVLLGTRKISGSEFAPIALETKLGFVVMGGAPTLAVNKFQVFTSTTDLQLNKLVEKFWTDEDIPSSNHKHPDDTKCEEMYSSTVIREESGRYLVKLLFKSDPTVLGKSYDLALKRLYSLEAKFSKFPEFKEKYVNVMEEYLRQGYMSKIDNFDISSPHYFIPHHGVIKSDSSSTPLRCVFDASAQTSTGLSLNDILYVGPKLQLEVFDLFLNFRLFAIAYTADIRQMYLRIGVQLDDRPYQLILWRKSNKESVSIFQLNTVTFGVKCSPFLALRTLKQLANDESKNFPVASKIVDNSFYMDDLIGSVDSLDEASQIYTELVQLFEAGQFHLTKWAVNHERLLQQIPISERSPKVVNFNNNGLKVLGLQWFPKIDIFSFQIYIESRPCTKRNVLSTVARLFDPLGFIAPVTLLFKLLIRTLWSRSLNWDEIADEETCCYWDKLNGELELLSKFRIPRHLGVTLSCNIMLIGFGDACLSSYGAVVYIRVMLPNRAVLVRLVCSKTKVAPTKVLTIPRLELCAAVLLAKLLKCVKNTLETRVAVEAVFALSDSKVVLHWINSLPYRWQIYVANRVALIQELIPSNHWHFIEGKQNISDILSRGLRPSEFLLNKTWIFGPNFLKLDVSSWPITRITEETIDLPEQKIISLVVVKKDPHPLENLIIRTSSWYRLIRSTVYVLRFAKILKSIGNISATDLEKAQLVLIRVVQRRHFNNEYLLLQNNKLCSNKFRPLSLFLWKGLIRVGGRLSNASIEFDQQHPFLLPNKDHFVNLLVDFCHKQNLHTGPTLVLAILRKKYWILGGRNLIRFRLSKCNYCFRFQPRNEFPKMADLPSFRVNESKPFSHCGVDYSGAFLVTVAKGRGIKAHKAYICLFICLVTKAIHLELVSDLSTEKFLAAFKRFLSRRGHVSVMYSDGGTNFLGAKNELAELYKLINSKEYCSELENELASKSIVWKFQPPLSPHFSGVWESQIKVVKTHLRKVIGTQILTFEEFYTVLTQIEAVLNSRPLTWLSTDPCDPIPLTPAHFLNLNPLDGFPALKVSSEKLVDRIKLLDQLVQGFWRRWHLEYLTQLQRRQKWTVNSPNIASGLLVLIKVDNCQPLKWPVGVVTETFPGSDGVVRVANVKTKSGIYKRPVVRLCPLPSQ